MMVHLGVSSQCHCQVHASTMSWSTPPMVTGRPCVQQLSYMAAFTQADLLELLSLYGHSNGHPFSQPSFWGIYTLTKHLRNAIAKGKSSSNHYYSGAMLMESRMQCWSLAEFFLKQNFLKMCRKRIGWHHTLSYIFQTFRQVSKGTLRATCHIFTPMGNSRNFRHRMGHKHTDELQEQLRQGELRPVCEDRKRAVAGHSNSRSFVWKHGGHVCSVFEIYAWIFQMLQVSDPLKIVFHPSRSSSKKKSCNCRIQAWQFFSPRRRVWKTTTLTH